MKPTITIYNNILYFEVIFKDITGQRQKCLTLTKSKSCYIFGLDGSSIRVIEGSKLDLLFNLPPPPHEKKKRTISPGGSRVIKRSGIYVIGP